MLELLNEADGGAHGCVIVAIAVQHNDEVGSGMDILPEILGRWILDGDDTAEALDALFGLA